MTDGPRDTVVVVGAGKGVGAAVASRFGSAGYAVGLIARNRGHLEEIAQVVRAEAGAPVAIAIADVTDPGEVRRALRDIADVLGEITVLCFSPIPDVELIHPVLETTPEEFMRSLQLNVAGAAAAVEEVLPSMGRSGRGSLLFTTGSGGITPSADRAASAVTTAAATMYIRLLRDALASTGVRVGHTIVVGPIDRDRPSAHHPDRVAEDLWRHHQGTAVSFPSILELGDG